MAEEITIPENMIEFCRDVARLAKARGLGNFSGSFNPGWKDPWRDRIEFSWDQGRHGEDSEELYVNSTKHIRTKLAVSNSA